MTILLGIAGAVLAGFLGQQLGWYEPGEGAGFLAAIVGAVVILVIYQLIMAVVNRSRLTRGGACRCPAPGSSLPLTIDCEREGAMIRRTGLAALLALAIMPAAPAAAQNEVARSSAADRHQAGRHRDRRGEPDAGHRPDRPPASRPRRRPRPRRCARMPARMARVRAALTRGRHRRSRRADAAASQPRPGYRNGRRRPSTGCWPATGPATSSSSASRDPRAPGACSTPWSPRASTISSGPILGFENVEACARRGADAGDRRRPRAGRALRAGARHAGQARGLRERGGRQLCAARPNDSLSELAVTAGVGHA